MWAARVSTMGERSQLRLAEDFRKRTGLINYLMKNRHGTPFEHNSMTFLVEAPIVVFREMQRHRAGVSFNEESGRYRKLNPVFYFPPSQRPLVQVGKAGHYQFEQGTQEQRTLTLERFSAAYIAAYNAYEAMVSSGVARELARCVLPGGIYVSCYVTMNARSLMHFLSLRTEGSAIPSYPMWEIKKVAELMEGYWRELMPVTAQAFDKNGRMAP